MFRVPEFNTDLYVVGAKLQVRELRRLMGQARQVAAETASGTHSTVVVLAVPRIYGALALPAVACIVLFGLGEVSAVLALNARHATAFEHDCVLAALVVLPAVLVSVTAVSIVMTGSRELMQTEERQPEDPRPEDPPPSPAS